MYFVYMVKGLYHPGKQIRDLLGEREDERSGEDKKARLGSILEKKVDIDLQSRKQLIKDDIIPLDISPLRGPKAPRHLNYLRNFYCSNLYCRVLVTLCLFSWIYHFWKISLFPCQSLSCVTLVSPKRFSTDRYFCSPNRTNSSFCLYVCDSMKRI